MPSSASAGTGIRGGTIVGSDSWSGAIFGSSRRAGASAVAVGVAEGTVVGRGVVVTIRAGAGDAHAASQASRTKPMLDRRMFFAMIPLPPVLILGEDTPRMRTMQIPRKSAKVCRRDLCGNRRRNRGAATRNLETGRVVTRSGSNPARWLTDRSGLARADTSSRS
jgi:hypothetical protein